MYYISNQNELYHHGILGQKWGIRRYQLSDGTWTEEGLKRRRLGDGYSNGKGLSDAQKRAIKKALIIGGTIAGAGLIAYGGYYVYKVNAYTYDTKAGRKIASKFRFIHEDNRPIDPKTHWPLKTHASSVEEDLAQVNRGKVSVFSDTKNLKIMTGGGTNCMICTTTYDLRRRGFDVSAEMHRDEFSRPEIFKSIYKDYNESLLHNMSLKKTTMSDVLSAPMTMSKSNKEIYKELENNLLALGPDGSRGNLMFYWMEGLGGHSIIWENSGGKIRFLDGQTNHEYKDFTNEIIKYLDKSSNDYSKMLFLRTDNLEINPNVMSKYLKTELKTQTYVQNAPDIALNIATGPIGAVSLASAGIGLEINAIKKQYKKEKEKSNKRRVSNGR